METPKKEKERRVNGIGLSLTVLIILGTAGHANSELPSLHGFAETAVGFKVSDDTTKRDDVNMLEGRLQLKATHYLTGEHYLAEKGAIFTVKGDFITDGYFSGATDFDLRALNLSFTPFRLVDVKIGRQVLTWGTGQYLFVNDLFPKDYVSFYIDRDDEYLKKPSDALKMSFYPRWANIDFVVIPYFEPNTMPKGDRLSFFDSFTGGIVGVKSDRHLISPPFQMSNNEYAARIYRSFGSHEYAFYTFRGFDKIARSYKDESARQLYYERLDVYGGSVRGPFAGGIGNIEFGYYNSREDTDGSDRLVQNSMVKVLAGYDKDLGGDLRAGVQYLLEKTLDYGNYRENLLARDFRWDEHRHVVTLSLNKQFWRQTLNVALFNYYSPSDNDGYIRPSVSYDVTDQWKVAAGANIPWGEDDLTEFGQMQYNKNVYLRVRYSF